MSTQPIISELPTADWSEEPRLTNDLQTELDLLVRPIRKIVGGANVEQ